MRTTRAPRRCDHHHMSASGGWYVGQTASTRYVRAGRVRGAMRRVLRSGGFRMVHLNVVGWVALLVPAAAVGLLAARSVRASAKTGGVTACMIGHPEAISTEAKQCRRSWNVIESFRPVRLACPAQVVTHPGGVETYHPPADLWLRRLRPTALRLGPPRPGRRSVQ